MIALFVWKLQAYTRVRVMVSFELSVLLCLVCLKVMINSSGNAIVSQLFDQLELDSKKRPDSVS